MEKFNKKKKLHTSLYVVIRVEKKENDILIQKKNYNTLYKPIDLSSKMR